MADYGPQIKLTRLYEKTSKNGNVYLIGRLGGAKIAILKSSEVAEDGGAIWNVMLNQAPERAKYDGASSWQAPADFGGDTSRIESEGAGGPSAGHGGDLNSRAERARDGDDGDLIPF